ncbi:MAG: hypothetical protein ACYC7D_04590 [Nitrososphaerales archaeon]
MFIPLATIFLVINVGGYGLKYVAAFLQYFTLQQSNQIFPFTLAAAWIVFIACFIVSIKRAHLNPLRAFVVAATLPFSGAGGFELIYQLIGERVQPCCFGPNAAAPVGPYEILSALTWVALGLTGLGFWKITRKFWIICLLIVLGFAVWVWIGFPQVTWGSPEQEPLAYALNILLKGGLFLIFLIPVLDGMLTKS